MQTPLQAVISVQIKFIIDFSSNLNALDGMEPMSLKEDELPYFLEFQPLMCLHSFDTRRSFETPYLEGK